MFSALGAIVIVTGASLSAAGPAAARTGLAFAWGYNYGGELGNGANTSTNLPVGVKGLAGVTAVSAGSHHCLALLSNGTVKAWGDNFYGELGNGTSTGTSTSTSTSTSHPVTVKGLTGVTAISAGGGDTWLTCRPRPSTASITSGTGR